MLMYGKCDLTKEELWRKYKLLLDVLSTLGIEVEKLFPDLYTPKLVVKGLALAHAVLEMYPFLHSSELGKYVKKISFEPFLKIMLTFCIDKPELGKLTVSIRPEPMLTPEQVLQQGRLGYFAEIEHELSESYRRMLAEALYKKLKNVDIVFAKKLEANPLGYVKPRLRYDFAGGKLSVITPPLNLPLLSEFDRLHREAERVAEELFQHCERVLLDFLRALIDSAHKKLRELLTRSPSL